MVEFSENWRRQVSPILDAVQKHSKSLSVQGSGLQPLIQSFSESLFEVKDKILQIVLLLILLIFILIRIYEFDLNTISIF